MAVVLVTGGTGRVGRHLVPTLATQHDVRVFSRRPEAHWRGDLATGEGLAAAVRGVDIVVHAASDTSRAAPRDVLQTRNLINALPADVRLVYVSIVGVDRIPMRYYRHKLACEQLVATSGRPHTIVRITQFHELLAEGLTFLERLPAAAVPKNFQFQPIAARDAAAVLADTVATPVNGRAPDVGGPEVLPLSGMLHDWQQVRGRPRRVVGLKIPGRIAAGFRQGYNTVPANATRGQTWADFVRERYGRQPVAVGT